MSDYRITKEDIEAALRAYPDELANDFKLINPYATVVWPTGLQPNGWVNQDAHGIRKKWYPPKP